jgi:hypothetical protein
LTTAKQYDFGFETASLELGGVLHRVSLNFEKKKNCFKKYFFIFSDRFDVLMSKMIFKK